MKCPEDPHDAMTPPVVGLRRYTRKGRCASLWRATAVVMDTIIANAGVPSCMRVPPEVGDSSSGSRSAVARSMPRMIRRAVAAPMEPAKKENSEQITATRRPPTSPSPVSTASSTPDFSRARSSVTA